MAWCNEQHVCRRIPKREGVEEINGRTSFETCLEQRLTRTGFVDACVRDFSTTLAPTTTNCTPYNRWRSVHFTERSKENERGRDKERRG